MNVLCTLVAFLWIFHLFLFTSSKRKTPSDRRAEKRIQWEEACKLLRFEPGTITPAVYDGLTCFQSGAIRGTKLIQQRLYPSWSELMLKWTAAQHMRPITHSVDGGISYNLIFMVTTRNQRMKKVFGSVIYSLLLYCSTSVCKVKKEVTNSLTIIVLTLRMKTSEMKISCCSTSIQWVTQVYVLERSKWQR